MRNRTLPGRDVRQTPGADHRCGQNRVQHRAAYSIEKDPRPPGQKKMPRARRRQDRCRGLGQRVVLLLKSSPAVARRIRQYSAPTSEIAGGIRRTLRGAHPHLPGG